MKHLYKRLTSCLLALLMLCSVTCTGFASEDDLAVKQPAVSSASEEGISPQDLTYYCEDEGTILPWQTKTGSFRVPGVFGANVTFMAGAANASKTGEIRIGILSAYYYVPCTNSPQIIDRLHCNSGTLQYSITNNSSETIAYAFYAYKTP